MAETGKSTGSHPCEFLTKLRLPTDENGPLSRAVTLGGAASYGLLSVNMLNPDLISNRDATNALLGGTILTGSLYLHTRKHMCEITDCKKNLLFCVYGSGMVTMGSVLLWAMMKMLLPENPVLRTAAAVGSSVVLLKTGVAYVDAIDKLIGKNPK